MACAIARRLRRSRSAGSNFQTIPRGQVRQNRRSGNLRNFIPARRVAELCRCYFHVNFSSTIRKAAVLAPASWVRRSRRIWVNANIPVLLFEPSGEGRVRRRTWWTRRSPGSRGWSRASARGGPYRGDRGVPNTAGSRVGRRMRSRDRGDRRAHGLETRPVCEGGAVSRHRPLRIEYFRAVDRRPVRCDAETVRPRFCGMQFFNLPRYMHLVELIAAPARAGLLDRSRRS